MSNYSDAPLAPWLRTGGDESLAPWLRTTPPAGYAPPVVEPAPPKKRELLESRKQRKNTRRRELRAGAKSQDKTHIRAAHDAAYVDYVRAHPGTLSRALADAVNVSTVMVNKRLTRLVDEGRLRRERQTGVMGDGSYAYWVSA